MKCLTVLQIFCLFLCLICFPAKGSAQEQRLWQELRLLSLIPQSYYVTSELESKSDPSHFGPYGGHNLFDNNNKSCWAEGADGDGVGQSIFFNIPANLSAIIVTNGYAKSKTIFRHNNRCQSLTLRLWVGFAISGKSTEFYDYYLASPFQQFEQNLRDTAVKQEIQLLYDWTSILALSAGKDNVPTENVSRTPTYILQLIISEIYKGDKYNDTCLSEIEISPADKLLPIAPIVELKVSDDQHVIYYITSENDKIVVSNNPALVYSIYSQTTDREWFVVGEATAAQGNGRQEEMPVLYNSRLKKRLAISKQGESFLLFHETSKGDYVETYSGALIPLADIYQEMINER